MVGKRREWHVEKFELVGENCELNWLTSQVSGLISELEKLAEAGRDEAEIRFHDVDRGVRLYCKVRR